MIHDEMDADVTMAGGAESTLLANRYRIVRQLGQGGMGSVWLAEDTELDNRQVAIKMLPSILLSNKRAYKQIKSEALVSLKLTHPNIATLRSFVENNGNPFLVIDYIKGRPLDDYLAERGALTEQETVALLSPIAAALDYAHARNVIHRDVKPSNVMIADDGTPYILDFGVAREMQDATTNVTGKLPSGTLKYMSPEQLHGAAPKASQDVYSFAAMVYECLRGAPPFARGQIEYQIEHDSPEPLPESFSIAKLVMAGLAKKPEDRPGTCSAVMGLLAAETSGTIPPQAFAEMSASPRATIGGKDVAGRLLQSAQSVLEVDRLLAEVEKFEDSCRDPRIHSSRMAIKSARVEMESASGARCAELLEAVKVIFAEAKSAYEDYFAKKHFAEDILKLISTVRGRYELRDDPGVYGCLREVEQFKADVEKSPDGEWQKLKEKFPAIREKTETEIRSAMERHREEEKKRQMEEAARRQQEELKRKQELEERKRQEQAEIESCREKIKSVKDEIRDERDKVVAYVKTHPDYSDCLPVAREICSSVYEEDPADLPGICKRLEKLETGLERIRSLISGHNLVVCAALNGVEVGRASMLYGERRIDLPVRIKGRQRLTKNEGYLVEYARGNQKYYGWFSPASAKSSDGQCAMVPLHKAPSISELTRALWKKNPAKYIWEVLVALVVSVEAAVLVAFVSYVGSMKKVWIGIAVGIAAVAIELRSLYISSMRKEMRLAVCDDSLYTMLPQSAFNESELLLDRKDRSTSELVGKFKFRNWLKCFWRLLAALYLALHIGIVVSICLAWASDPIAPVCGIISALVTLAVLFAISLRREKFVVLIGLDGYRSKRVVAPTVVGVKEAPVKETAARTKKLRWHGILWGVAFCILVACGLSWQYWKTVKAREEQRAAEAKRQADEEEKELRRLKNEINAAVRSGTLRAGDVENYRADSQKLEIYITSVDDAVRKLKSVRKPNSIAEARKVLDEVNVACENISGELERLKESKRKRDDDRRKAKEEAERRAAEAERRAAEAERRAAEAVREKRNQELAEARDRAKAIEDKIVRDIEPELKRFNAWGCTRARNAYNEGYRQLKNGKTCIEDGDYAAAEDRLAKARDKLAEAVLAAKNYRIDQHLTNAREYGLAGEWQRCMEECDAALNVDATNPEAMSLKGAAETHLEPPVSLSRRPGRQKIEQMREQVADQPRKQRQISESVIANEFTSDHANTLSLLGPMPEPARGHYDTACTYALKGSIYMPQAKSEYKKGRESGGPKWPELEAWLDKWK